MPHGPHKFDSEGDVIDRLEGQRRRERLPLDVILPRLALSGSETLIDMGPGTGYFTFPVSQRVGQVIGLEIDEKMLGILRQRIRERSADNVLVVKGDMNRLPFADSVADHVLAAFVYHEVADQAKLMEEVARVLRRGGRLTVIDFQKRLESDGPPIWVRKSPAHVKRTASKRFTLVSSDGTKGYYQLMFSKN